MRELQTPCPFTSDCKDLSVSYRLVLALSGCILCQPQVKHQVHFILSSTTAKTDDSKLLSETAAKSVWSTRPWDAACLWDGCRLSEVCLPLLDLVGFQVPSASPWVLHYPPKSTTWWWYRLQSRGWINNQKRDITRSLYVNNENSSRNFLAQESKAGTADKAWWRSNSSCRHPRTVFSSP